MSEKRNRAWRRAQEQRIKSRVKKYYVTKSWLKDVEKWHYRWHPDIPIGTEIGRIVGLMAHSKKLCSCWMCGHRTELEGPPIRDVRREPIDDGDTV